MKNLIKILFISVCISMFLGCTTTGTSQEGSASAKPAKSAKPTKVYDGSDTSPDSLFSKLALKMGSKQVYDLVGQPNDSKRYSTGKEWIPYYMGNDTSREELFYKNEGRLIFANNDRLIKIVVDPSEDGYK